MVSKPLAKFLDRLPQCYTDWDHLTGEQQRRVLDLTFGEVSEDEINHYLCNRQLSCKTDSELEDVWKE